MLMEEYRIFIQHLVKQMKQDKLRQEIEETKNA